MKLKSTEIKALKQKHGDVFEIEVEDKVAYVKKPGRKELSYATAVSASDPFKMNETLLEACWIAGDKEILEDDEYFLPACSVLEELIKTKEAKIKKL